MPTTLADGTVTSTSVVIPKRTSTIVNVVTGTKTGNNPALQTGGGLRARDGGALWIMAALIGITSVFAAF